MVRSELGDFKYAILSITFLSYVQKCDTVDLDSGHVLTIFHICDTVGLNSHYTGYTCCTEWAGGAGGRAGGRAGGLTEAVLTVAELKR